MRRRLPLIGAACLITVACGSQAPRRSTGPFVVQRAGFTGHYAADGRLERLVKDADSNGKPEAVILYRPNGNMQSAELDQDGDGGFDRWEQFNAAGGLEKIASSRQNSGKADTWEYLDASGASVVRREIDDDGDGKADRTEDLASTATASDSLDTDGDGRPDRRLIRGAAGEVTAVEVDPDGDGRWERKAAVGTPGPAGKTGTAARP